MAIQFEDLLSVVCPGFELKHATDFQKNYMVPDEKAAKLAFDILIAYGFDAKVYPSEDETAGTKLYITLPAADADPRLIEQRLLSALAYGRALTDIKLRMDSLCRDDAALIQSPSYTMTFANGVQGAKQLVIGITPAQAAQAATTPQMQQQAAANRPAQPMQANRPAAKKAVKKEDDGFNQGPSIAKQLYSSGGKDGKPDDDIRRRMFLFITGNIATGGAGVLAAVVTLFVVFSFFVLAKGFLCPDFAVEKKNVNRAWYCDNPNKKEDPNKPKLPELPDMPQSGNIR